MTHINYVTLKYLIFNKSDESLLQLHLAIKECRSDIHIITILVDEPKHSSSNGQFKQWDERHGGGFEWKALLKPTKRETYIFH